MCEEIKLKIKEEISSLIDEILLEHDSAEPDHIGDYTINIIQAIKLTELHIQRFVTIIKDDDK